MSQLPCAHNKVPLLFLNKLAKAAIHSRHLVMVITLAYIKTTPIASTASMSHMENNIETNIKRCNPSQPRKLYLADPGNARGCSTNSLVIHSFILSLIQSVSQLFPPTALRRRHAQTVKDRSSCYEIDYVRVIKNFLNPEGH